MKDAVIIGGGIGGLFTGAILSKYGYKVTVLEKNAIVGGGMQCFRRKGKIFETGMHVLGGFEPGGSLERICGWLGVLDKLNIHHIPHDCMDEIRYGGGDIYRIPSGRDNFVRAMAEYFPEERDGIAAYLDRIYEIADDVALFNLREDAGGIVMHDEDFAMAADKLIARYVENPKLREVLAYLNPLYGGVAGHTPAYIHALINVLYINGASRFVGGSQQLADALCDVIRAGGGDVLAGKEVTKIEVENRVAQRVLTADGAAYEAEWVISAIHPSILNRIVTPGAFLRGYSARLDEIPVSNSAFSLFFDLKPGRFPYIDHTCYFMEDYGRIWAQASQPDDDSWPCGFMYMTPPDPDQGEYADRLLVHCIMDFAEVEKWRDTRVGRRGADYEQWKKSHVDRVIAKLEMLFPGFAEMVENVYAASPLTIRDYYATKDGAIFGYRKDSENMMLSQLPVFTKVRNLLLTGQNINLHGICGVPLTAINTAEAILGLNRVVADLNAQ